jgi:hypothetical protein
MVFAHSEFIGLMFTRVRSSAPIFTWSMVSFSGPSAPLLKALILHLPLLRLSSRSLMCLTAATVG